MNPLKATLALLLLLAASAALPAQNLSWDQVKHLAPGAFIWVVTEKIQACVVVTASDQALTCAPPQSDTAEHDRVRNFAVKREDVKSIQMVPRRQWHSFDDSRGSFDFMSGFYAGAGVDARNQPDAYGGGRIGRLVTLDMGYDCFKGHCGFDAQNTAVLPFFRYPFYRPDKHQNFFKVFLEPGVGYHFGGDLHTYTSAGALVLLNGQWSHAVPYIEYTHRFPVGSPWQGDNRIAVGILMVVPQAYSSN